MRVAAEVKQDAIDQQFMGLIAHEVRNPLMPIRNALMAIDCMEIGDPRTGWARAVIQRQVQVIADLVQTLVEISALTSRRVKRYPVTSLERACSAAFETVAGHAAQNGTQIVMTTPLPDAKVAFQTRPLKRVIAILLGYAIHQTAPGKAITCVVRLEGETAIIEVSEHHRGVSESELASLFELHGSTTGVPDSMHGVRLTLYLAKRLAERHGGTLQGHSEGFGMGSTLELRVPLAPFV